MKKGMIVSLGGSPEPIIYSINHHRPDVVSFLATQESLDLIGQVKEALAYPLDADHKELVGSPNQLLDCFRHSLTCWQQLMARDVDLESVLVDFTGGTKVMSAALGLLGILKGCRFSYVGGYDRTKGGVGTVITGAEQVFENVNPWEAMALHDERLAMVYFNQHRFAAAHDTFQEAGKKTQQLNTPLGLSFSYLAGLAAAYQAWEAFRHKDASEMLKTASHDLQLYQDSSSDQKFQPLLGQIKGNTDFLNKMAGQSRGFQQPCRAYVLDLVANGRRRADADNFDDAVLRLYRALEMRAQSELRTGFGIDTGNVPPQKIPEALREEFVGRYSSGNESLQIPLEASYRLLDALGDPVGALFIQMQDRFKNVQFARNSSWLAHGTQQVSKEAYSSLLKLTLDLCQIADLDLPVFPQMSWEIPW